MLTMCGYKSWHLIARSPRDPEARAFVDHRCFTFSSHDATGRSHGMMFPKCVRWLHKKRGEAWFYCLVCGTIVDSQEPEMSFFFVGCLVGWCCFQWNTIRFQDSFNVFLFHSIKMGLYGGDVTAKFKSEFKLNFVNFITFSKLLQIS